jgi:hypothetical protein
LNHVPELLGWPQHYYLVPPGGAWCFNYTFEDYMYFGFGVSDRRLFPRWQRDRHRGLRRKTATEGSED